MATKPREKVILTFDEEPRKKYRIVHLNEQYPKTSTVILEGKTRRGIFIASYEAVKDCSQDYFIRKDYRIGGMRDILDVPEGSSVEEEVHDFALKEAQRYAKEKRLPFEDLSNFQKDPYFPF